MTFQIIGTFNTYLTLFLLDTSFNHLIIRKSCCDFLLILAEIIKLDFYLYGNLR